MQNKLPVLFKSVYCMLDSPKIVYFFGESDTGAASKVKSLRNLGIPHSVSQMATFKAFLNSPVGPKTTHFWGPVANWGIITAGILDTQKPPDVISGNMTSVMCVYSALFMRFAWMVKPRNYFLLVTHASNETVQLYQLSRWAKAQGYLKQNPDKAA
ncbi:mitochondrial pyruvate carrier 1-like isoform X1 [Capsicum annuum]|nr:mitochondrial pyruvate carrier 1-like isoform X1 [Capsicum annuum]XP_047258670.1 mitochondrial pyruvate carrier 1-like isoform X1 [Capsicum annuum]